MSKINSLSMFGMLLMVASPLYADIQVHTTDFIPNQLRTNFDSFEALPATP